MKRKELKHTLVLSSENFLYLSMLAFLLISTTTLILTKNLPQVKGVSTVLTTEVSKIYPPLPVLLSQTTDAPTNPGSEFPIISAQGALAVDLESGVHLYEKNADAPLLPASTTKIITALVALDEYPLDQVFTVPKEALVEGQKMGLKPEEMITTENLLYGLLVFSANDAAQTLAYGYPGGYSAFVSAMNTKAASLFMTNTRFDNPVGLDGNNQRSTARDLVRASEVAMKNPEFARIVSTKERKVTDITGNSVYDIKNLNQLLFNVPGVLGVKTGWTLGARENLVTYITRDGHRVMIAILGSQDRFGETKELIDWIFTSYKWQEVSPELTTKSNYSE